MIKKKTTKKRSGKRERQRHPFRKETKIIELLNNNSIRDLDNLIRMLQPYLLDMDVNIFTINRLYFDLQKIAGQRKVIYLELKLFFKNVMLKRGLKCKQSHFFRYLTNPEHCNLGISENTIKAILNQ